ncbi:hypothetical protein [Nocardia gipuzkoensis]
MGDSGPSLNLPVEAGPVSWLPGEVTEAVWVAAQYRTARRSIHHDDIGPGSPRVLRAVEQP